MRAVRCGAVRCKKYRHCFGLSTSMCALWLRLARGVPEPGQPVAMQSGAGSRRSCACWNVCFVTYPRMGGKLTAGNLPFAGVGLRCFATTRSTTASVSHCSATANWHRPRASDPPVQPARLTMRPRYWDKVIACQFCKVYSPGMLLFPDLCRRASVWFWRCQPAYQSPCGEPPGRPTPPAR